MRLDQCLFIYWTILDPVCEPQPFHKTSEVSPSQTVASAWSWNKQRLTYNHSLRAVSRSPKHTNSRKWCTFHIKVVKSPFLGCVPACRYSGGNLGGSEVIVKEKFFGAWHLESHRFTRAYCLCISTASLSSRNKRDVGSVWPITAHGLRWEPETETVWSIECMQAGKRLDIKNCMWQNGVLYSSISILCSRRKFETKKSASYNLQEIKTNLDMKCFIDAFSFFLCTHFSNQN